MRIKAYIGEKTPVYEMANGASESVGYISPNSYVTLTGIKKDGANSYYITEEYPGYIKRTAVKVLRDEEFYYSSTLVRERKNRSKSNRFNSMRTSVAADPGGTTVRPSTSWTGSSSGWNVSTAGGGNINSNMQQSWNNSSSGVIPKYDTTTVRKAANNSNGPHPVTPMMAVANVAGNVIGAKLSKNPVASFGAQALTSFATTGSWDAVNNANLGGLFGGSKLGGLLNGATINNLMDGSFFTNGLLGNLMNTITGLLGTLMQKLDYVVGFNMSGMLLDIIGGFASWQSGKFGVNRTFGDAYRPPERLTQNNGALDQHIRNYFKYKGSSYNMTPYGGVLGGVMGQPDDYRTGSMSSANYTGSIASGTQIHHNDYKTLYAEFEEGITKIRSSMSINITRMDWFYNFNRFRMLTPSSVLANSKGYVFFTRPDLNLRSSSGLASEIGLLINSVATYHAGIMASLEKAPSGGGASFDNGHQLIPLLCNRCTGLDINDETLETKEIGETYTGWKLNYGMNNIKSKSVNTVTTSFIDDEQLSIYLLFKLWTEYISNVSRGIIAPKDEYARSLQLDYANSIYYFLCAEDGESIIFWTKYTGCIPTNSPSSNFTDSFDSAIRQPKYSITWQYAFKKDYDPYSLAEFNRIAGCQEGSQPGSMPIYDAESLRTGRTIAGSPWVDTQTGGLYKLHFREPQNTFKPEY